jgi:hypothetical protein
MNFFDGDTGKGRRFASNRMDCSYCQFNYGNGKQSINLKISHAVLGGNIFYNNLRIYSFNLSYY